MIDKTIADAQRRLGDAIDNFKLELYKAIGVDRFLRYIIRKIGGEE